MYLQDQFYEIVGRFLNGSDYYDEFKALIPPLSSNEYQT